MTHTDWLENCYVVHAHDFLHMLLDADPPCRVDDLPALVEEKFGPDARFQNCKERVFTLDELVSFLGSRGKISIADGVVQANKARMCNH